MKSWLWMRLTPHPSSAGPAHQLSVKSSARDGAAYIIDAANRQTTNMRSEVRRVWIVMAAHSSRWWTRFDSTVDARESMARASGSAACAPAAVHASDPAATLIATHGVPSNSPMKRGPEPTGECITSACRVDDL